MKIITYKCDICKKDIKNPSADLCYSVRFQQDHSWEDPQKAKYIFEGCICSECSKKLENTINEMKQNSIGISSQDIYYKAFATS